jgi:hypothetical protein
MKGSKSFIIKMLKKAIEVEIQIGQKFAQMYENLQDHIP